MPYDDFYEVYKERYDIIKHQREIAKSEEIPSPEKYRLKPNSMQERFIANLRKILEQGEERALLISATGTGKTYASAFAMRELGFKRVLFLVHRVTLAKQAKKSFEKVFDKKVTMGLVEARNARKEDNRGRMQPITKVTMKMQHSVREDLLRYLQSNITA